MSEHQRQIDEERYEENLGLFATPPPTGLGFRPPQPLPHVTYTLTRGKGASSYFVGGGGGGGRGEVFMVLGAQWCLEVCGLQNSAAPEP